MPIGLLNASINAINVVELRTMDIERRLPVPHVIERACKTLFFLFSPITKAKVQKNSKR